MSDLELQQIQSLQFSNLEAANQRLKQFIEDNTHFSIETVEATPSAVSLNSINGILKTKSGSKLFFKTHVEPQSIISEYYNSGILAEAGYPIIRPIYSSTTWGKQILIYEFFEFPSLFNVVRDLETGKREDTEQVVEIQRSADRQLFQIYRQTLQPLSPTENAKSPVHQLFHYRLVGGRFTEFYHGSEITLPRETIKFEQLAQLKWTINGVEFQETLGELVQKAKKILDPNQEEVFSVIGHGDAHNGNVLVDEKNANLIYFDPAFAGRHSPLLDLAKPVFHNCFATWMYFPEEISEHLSIDYKIENNRIFVEHDFPIHPVKKGFLKSKLNLVLEPLLQESFKEKAAQKYSWQEYFKLALLCCPLLTMNLADSKKFPPKIALLGFCYAIEMGSFSSGNQFSPLDAEIHQIVSHLN